VVCTVLLAAVYIPATAVRIGKLAACGAAARSIVTGLPADEWREGEWQIRLAPAPGEPQTRRYGFNGYRSIYTIGFPDDMNAVQGAFRTLYRNPRLNVNVLSPRELMLQCDGASVRRNSCFWIHWDGRVTEAAAEKPGFGLDY
jgi:hypothetical protein